MGKLTKHTQKHLKFLALTFIVANILIKLKMQNKLWKTLPQTTDRSTIRVAFKEVKYKISK